MPEIVEVRLTQEFLHNYLTGECVEDWTLIDCKAAEQDNTDFEKALPLLVDSVKRKGKFIYFTLTNGEQTFYVLHSMRMTGSWLRDEPDYCTSCITLENKPPLYFRDPRKFATFTFTNDYDVLAEYLDKLGPDVMSNEFTLEAFEKIVRKHSRKNITSMLMNQDVLSGIGNWIKSEVLYEACISPLRRTGSLEKDEVEVLYNAIRRITEEAYRLGGVSVRDYVDENGEKGEYEHYLQAYGNPDMTCTKTPDGRTTWWDEERQV